MDCHMGTECIPYYSGGLHDTEQRPKPRIEKRAPDHTFRPAPSGDDMCQWCDMSESEHNRSNEMATWVNREAWWAVDRRRVVHVVRVLEQNLQAETMTVLLENGARHEAPAYDVHLTENAAELQVAFHIPAGLGRFE